MLKKLADVLEATGIPFREAAWDRPPAGDYGVYAIDGSASSLWADGHMEAQALEGTIDLFTHSGGQEKIVMIQDAMNSIPGLSWYLNSVQFETDTKLMHTEWVISFVLEH